VGFLAFYVAGNFSGTKKSNAKDRYAVFQKGMTWLAQIYVPLFSAARAIAVFRKSFFQPLASPYFLVFIAG